MKQLPLYLRFLFLPLTTLIDMALSPSDLDWDFYEEAQFFIGGLHVVCWIRLMFLPILLLICALFETSIREAVLIANRLYQKQHFFDAKQILAAWDKGSFSYDCLKFEVLMCILFAWLIFACAFRKSICFVPLQWIGIFTLVRSLFYTFYDHYVRIQNEFHMLNQMDQIKRDLRSLRTRAFEFPIFSVSYEFAPIVRVGAEFAVVLFLFFMVFVIERVMLYYGYEKSLVSMYDTVFNKHAKEPKSPTISIDMQGFA